jgi:ABC-type amino acid transport substrate-binding protein
MRLWLNLLALALATPAMARSLTISAPDWPPFYIHEDRKTPHKGMAWDILATCASKIDKNPVFDMYPIRRMFKYMEAGDLDLNIMSFKTERTSTVDYGKEVVFENTYSVWSRDSLTIKVKSLADLDNLNVALLIGMRPSAEYKKWLERRQSTPSGKETLILNEQEQILRMLADDRIDATVGSTPEFRWRARKLGLTSKLKPTGLVIQKQAYFFVVAKESPIYKQNPRILQRMDQCVKEMKKSGTWLKLKDHYQL